MDENKLALILKFNDARKRMRVAEAKKSVALAVACRPTGDIAEITKKAVEFATAQAEAEDEMDIVRWDLHERGVELQDQANELAIDVFRMVSAPKAPAEPQEPEEGDGEFEDDDEEEEEAPETEAKPEGQEG